MDNYLHFDICKSISTRTSSLRKLSRAERVKKIGAYMRLYLIPVNRNGGKGVDLRPFFLHARRAIIFEVMTYALIWTSIYQNVRNRPTSNCGRVVTVPNPKPRCGDQNPRRVESIFSSGKGTGRILPRSKLASVIFYDRDNTILQKKLATCTNSYVRIIGYFFLVPARTLYLHPC